MSFDLLNPRPSWSTIVLASLAVHAALAGGMALVEPEPKPPRSRIIPVSVVLKEDPPPKPPPPKKEKEPEPEKPEAPPREPVVQEKPPEMPPPDKPRAKKRKRAKKRAPPKPTRPQATPPPPSDAPPPPPLMGLALEGATLAAPGTGIAVPQGQADGERYGAYGGTGDRKNRVNSARQGPPPSGDDDVDRTVPVAGVNTMPVLVEDAKPKYPPEIKREGVEGRVVLSIVVGRDGRVRAARVVKRLDPRLDKAALAAAKRLRFRPAMANGKKVAVRIPYTFTFVIE